MMVDKLLGDQPKLFILVDYFLVFFVFQQTWYYGSKSILMNHNIQGVQICYEKSKIMSNNGENY
jgi:hypothetical protein